MVVADPKLKKDELIKRIDSILNPMSRDPSFRVLLRLVDATHATENRETAHVLCEMVGERVTEKLLTHLNEKR